MGLTLRPILYGGLTTFGRQIFGDPHELVPNGYILAALNQRQNPDYKPLHSLAIHGAPAPRQLRHNTKMP